MTLSDKLKAKMKTLLVMAPEYGRIARTALQQYEFSHGTDREALMKSIEFGYRERLCYEEINWISEMLRGE